MRGNRWRRFGVVIAIGAIALSVACTSTSVPEAQPPSDAGSEAPPPPPAGSWSVTSQGITADRLCASGYAAYCPPPEPVVTAEPEPPAEVSPPCPLCDAFAPPPGRIQPGPKPEGVPDIIVMPDNNAPDTTDPRRPPDVEIPPVTPPPPPPPFVG